MDRLTNAQLDRPAIHQQRKHKFVLYGELDTETSKPWLVRGLLGATEQSVVYGRPGSGKSVLVGDLGLHVAAGLDWHGRKVKAGAVLYIALERRKLVERRVIAWRDRHQIDRLPFAVMSNMLDFRAPRTADEIAAVVREVETETRAEMTLIIIDTISRALAGGDENGPRDMGALVNVVGTIQAKTAAHVLLVHHMPQDGSERMRGHGALLGAMDTTIHVEKLAGGLRCATVVKANDSEEGERVTFGLESVVIGIEDEGQETTAPVVVPVDPAVVRHARSESRWTKGLRLIQESIVAVMSEGQAIEHRVAGDEPIVRVVFVEDARLFHRQRYVHGGDGDRAEAERKAWHRNMKEARNRCLIGSGLKDGREVVWLLA